MARRSPHAAPPCLGRLGEEERPVPSNKFVLVFLLLLGASEGVVRRGAQVDTNMALVSKWTSSLCGPRQRASASRYWSGSTLSALLSPWHVTLDMTPLTCTSTYLTNLHAPACVMAISRRSERNFLALCAAWSSHEMRYCALWTVPEVFRGAALRPGMFVKHSPWSPLLSQSSSAAQFSFISSSVFSLFS